MMSDILPPALLSHEHVLDAFDSGEASLDEWLRKTALKNQVSGASRCYVIADSQAKVVAYYTLSAGAIHREDAPTRMQRNVPDPLPIVLIGRLAVDQGYQNKGLGKAMLRDGMIRIVQAAAEIGIFAVLLHALSEQAKRFYLSCGFIESPLQPMTLMMTVKTAFEIILEPN